jgi:hypothetical protein
LTNNRTPNKEPKQVKQQPKLHQPYIRAKIIGGVLIIIGVAFLVNPTPLFIKLAFASILIGVFMIVLITEQSVPRKISDAQIEGNFAFTKKMIKELKLAGNAVFLPKSHLLSEERVFIPAQKTTEGIIPFIDNEVVISTGTDGKNLGISVPPAGLMLLKELETEASFDHIGFNDIEEKLQTFVGMNILKSVTLKKEPNGWRLELEHPEPCCVDQPTCAQYPCSACSAVLTAITQAAHKKIWIQEIANAEKKTIFHLKIGD